MNETTKKRACQKRIIQLIEKHGGLCFGSGLMGWSKYGINTVKAARDEMLRNGITEVKLNKYGVGVMHIKAPDAINLI